MKKKNQKNANPAMALANYPATQTQITFQHALHAKAQALFWMINTSQITMKKLSETYKELGIAFTFPITILDTNGKLTYYEESDGCWCKCEYDDNGNQTYYESSTGFWSKSEHEDNGNQTYYESSKGYWSKSEYNDNGKTTYYESSTGYWYKREYDGNGNITYYESSAGDWYKREHDDNGNETYYANSYGTKRGTPKSKHCAGKFIEVDGIKYNLTPVK